jgi:nucleotide-binding universal stress UspA family protein
LVSLKQILYATDLSESSGIGLKFAIELARASCAQLHVLHVIDYVGLMPWGPAVVYPENERIKLTEELRKRLEDHVGGEKPPGMQIETMLVEGKPFSKILEIAENQNMDVIVLNLQSRSALERAFLGSTAERVVRLARTQSFPFLSPRAASGIRSGLSCEGSARCTKMSRPLSMRLTLRSCP